MAFAREDEALAALPGATVALEGDEPLVAMLAELAEAIGAQPVRVPAGAKAAYHAAAVMAAGAEIALLDAIVVAGPRGRARRAGVAGGLPAARRAGAGRRPRRSASRAALTGPVVRGDVGTVRAHLEALARLAPDTLDLYRATAEREVAMALAEGRLTAEQAATLRAVLPLREAEAPGRGSHLRRKATLSVRA